MKFGKYIQSQQVEWAGPQYLNYKGLKKIINSLNKQQPTPTTTNTATAAATASSSSNSISADAAHHHHHQHDENRQYNEMQALKTAFFFKLERELEK
ncbi:hypothetical protein HDU88_007480, partial [Geranomyces variabilis]